MLQGGIISGIAIPPLLKPSELLEPVDVNVTKETEKNLEERNSTEIGGNTAESSRVENLLSVSENCWGQMPVQSYI